MTADDASSFSIGGTLNQGVIPPHQSIGMVEEKVRRYIRMWTPDKMNVEDPLSANERTLASSLCIFLTQMGREEGVPFFFHNETPQAKRSLDMAAFSSFPNGIVVDNHCYSRNEFFYAIEAKILPLRSAREREYVVSDHLNCGSSTKKIMGGIERFKQGVHAPNLSRASLVAFVQEIPETPWMVVMNGWIDGLNASHPVVHRASWNASDYLVGAQIEDSCDECVSEHLRPTGDAIRLCHFWLYLAGKS